MSYQATKTQSTLKSILLSGRANLTRQRICITSAIRHSGKGHTMAIVKRPVIARDSVVREREG